MIQPSFPNTKELHDMTYLGKLEVANVRHLIKDYTRKNQRNVRCIVVKGLKCHVICSSTVDITLRLLGFNGFGETLT